MLLAAALTVSCLPFVAYADEPVQVPEIRGENLLDGVSWAQESGDAITEITGEENTYVHISGLEPYVTAAEYSSGTVNTGSMPAGSYKISMMLRSVPATFEETDTTLGAVHTWIWEFPLAFPIKAEEQQASRSQTGDRSSQRLPAMQTVHFIGRIRSIHPILIRR